MLITMPDPTEPDASELMGRYCDGDAQAFRELYGLLAPPVFRWLVAMTRDEILAADLLQQSFLTAHRTRAAYIRDADPLPWIYSIAARALARTGRSHSDPRSTLLPRG